MTDTPLARYADLAGRTVFVSGGATGIGADLVTAFHGQDCDVVFVDIDADAGEALRDRLAGRGAAPLFIPCDVTDIPALRAALAAAEGFGSGLDVLVNNAANDTRMPFEAVTEDDWTRALDVNLKHQFFAAQTACGWMKGRGRGSIVNFGSVAPQIPVADLTVYNACKAAVRGLTRSIAKDMGGHGIRCNAIVPGAILTPRQRALWYTDQTAIDAMTALQCLPRELCGQDVAQMALFLASDASAACSAQEFIVDGGIV